MLNWQAEQHALGVAAIDTTHQEFIAGLAGLLVADKAAFPELFRALAAHTLTHFDNESGLMRQCRFPAIAEHEGEHRRVLGELAQMGRLLERGQLAMVRAYVESLPDWFGRHLATMDAALAACLRNQRLPAQV